MSLSFGYSFSFLTIVAATCVILFAVLVAAAAVRGTKARWIVASLRGALWLLTISLFLRASFVYVEKELVKRPLAFVIDRSQSMNMPVSPSKTRWQEVKSFLHDGFDWERLERDFHLTTYSLSDVLTPTSRKAIVQAKNPEGKASRLRHAITTLSDGTPWAGIVILSDGVDTDNVQPKEKIDSPPVVLLHSTPQQGVRDVAILRVTVPDLAYFKARVTIDVHVEAVNVPRDSLELRAWSGERMLARTRLVKEGWGENHQQVVPLSFTPDKAGPTGITVEVTQYPGEVTFENNEKSVVLRVLRDRVRVLHVAGRPSWDVRFLRKYLKEDPNIDLISFFILRSPTNNPEASQDELSLIPFPYNDLFTKDLNNFDLVVFQNFNFRSYFSPYYLSNIRRYVEEGGAFVMIGGDLSFGRAHYQDSPIEDILPVRVRDDAAEINTDSFRPRLAKGGRSHPILANRIRSAELAQLPALWGYHRVLALQPQSLVLLEHPADKLNQKNTYPILVSRQVGLGRTIAILTDSFWRWAFVLEGSQAKVYRNLWNGMYRWLVQDPSFSYLRLNLPTKAKAKSPIRIEVQTSDYSYAPVSGLQPIITYRIDRDKLISKRLSRTNSEGYSEEQLAVPTPAILNITATVPEKEKYGYSAHGIVVIEPDTQEFQRRVVDTTFLASHFKQVTVKPISKARLSDLAPLYAGASYRNVGKQEWPWWDHPLLLLAILSLASLEWWYRRRHGAP